MTFSNSKGTGFFSPENAMSNNFISHYQTNLIIRLLLLTLFLHIRKIGENMPPVKICKYASLSNGDLPPFIKDYMPTHTWVRYAARLRWHMRAALNSEYAHHNQIQ